MKKSRILLLTTALVVGLSVPAFAGGDDGWDGWNYTPFRSDHSIDEVTINAYTGATWQSGCVAKVEPLALRPGVDAGYRMQGRILLSCNDTGLRFSKFKWSSTYLADGQEVYSAQDAVFRATPWNPNSGTIALNRVDLSCKQVNSGPRGSYVSITGRAYVSLWDTNGVKYKTNELAVPLGGVVCPDLTRS